MPQSRKKLVAAATRQQVTHTKQPNSHSKQVTPRLNHNMRTRTFSWELVAAAAAAAARAAVPAAGMAAAAAAPAAQSDGIHGSVRHAAIAAAEPLHDLAVAHGLAHVQRALHGHPELPVALLQLLQPAAHQP